MTELLGIVERMNELNPALIDAINRIKRQEEQLVFNAFNAQTAFDIGCALIESAQRDQVAYAINISLNRRQLFHFSMDGCVPDNDSWLRRKENTVYHFHKSSMRVALEFRLSGEGFHSTYGLSPEGFANSGGSFPINIKGTGVVGAITVSGLPEEIDHNYVVEAVTAYLDKH